MISVVIPTRHRPAKLQRALKSLQSVRAPIRVIVVVDGEGDTAGALEGVDFGYPLSVYCTSRHVGSVAARNRGLRESPLSDHVLLTRDDVVFDEGSIDTALRMLLTLGDDYVVGFSQGHTPHTPTNICLVGKDFRKRFPKSMLYYPKYWHFGEDELYAFTKSVNRFRYCKGAGINHNHHPDGTHYDARIRSKQDHRLRSVRKAKGELWGHHETG